MKEDDKDVQLEKVTVLWQENWQQQKKLLFRTIDE